MVFVLLFVVGVWVLGFDRKRRVKFLYDNTARLYDRRYRDIQMVKYGVLLKKLYGEKFLVVDVGCGIGLLCELLAVKRFRVIGVDFSIEMLREARKFASLPGVFFLCCDSDFLPLRSKVFCGAFSVTLLQNLPNPVISLSEMIRVCKKGSILHLSVLSKSLNTKDLELLLSKAGLKDIEVFGSFGSEDIYGFGKI